MAEFADLSGSVQGGSDADFEKSCHPCSGPCFDVGRRMEATKYCPQCKEYLCTACTRCHTRFTATREHQLTDPVKHNGSGKGKRAKAILNPSCSLHSDREIEMFCGSQDMVYCALCIAKDHRLCNNVSEIAEAAKCRTLAHTSIGDKISYLRDELVVAKEEKIGNIQTFGTEKNEHLMKVKRTSRKIISHIERLRDEASTSIERKYEKIEQELQADTMTITEAIEKLDKSREQISSLENLNQTQRFVQEKIQKQLLAGIEKLSISTKQKKARAIQYTANEGLIEQIIAATFLVKIEERRQTEERSLNKEPLKIKSKKEVNIKKKDDKDTCWIIGICQLPDGTIILADEKNRTIKRLDNDYKVKDHCDLGSGPLGICCSGELEVAVKVGGSKDGKIQFVHYAVGKIAVDNMAEEGGCNVSVRGSDAEFEYACTPCTEDGSNQEAVKYCPECKEYLCAACTKYHKKFSATKKHNLLEKDLQKHEHTFETSVGVVKKRDKCAAHAERDIEMYCGSHDMVYCTLCIAKDHRSCTDVFEIEEAVTRFSVQSDEIMVEKVESVLKQMIEMKQSKDENIQTVEKQNKEMQMKVQQTKNKLIQHVEKLADETTKTVDTLHTSLIQELANERDTVYKSITTLENCRRQLDSSGNFDKSEQFVKQKLHNGILSAAENLFDDTCQFESKKITCKENDVLIDQIMSATSLIQVERNVVQKPTLNLPPSVKSVSTVSVKESSDTEVCNIVGICQLSDGTIILADCANSKVKRLDDQYRVSDHCVLEAGPTGICCTGINEVAVKLANNKVQFVSVGAQMLKTRAFDIEGGIYIGFVRFADTLWSYNGNGADIYCKSGTLLKTLKNDSPGKQLIKSTSSTRVFPVASNKSSVYVSDLGSRVLCLDASENVDMMLTETKLKDIKAACISNYDVMFAAGYSSHNIMMFGSDGKSLGELIASDQGIGYPKSLCYDRKKHKLVVGCANNISVIDLSV
ncbi:uncharacterized protein LOC123549616 [Mercenaria mercenaria]|uniref:uncharacterized protein LOC123549616 n=1 Tax=Mercenaria mercenaria TaxID=6596 RepID=UPI00234F1EFA|nr:uncharacterized protein LOC123549616 [Mercenaria mercenaria]